MNILISGVGGQGVLRASEILAEAAMKHNIPIKASETHGMAQRGGSVVTYVRMSNKAHGPLIPEGDADVILAFEAAEALRYINYAGPKTKVIMNEFRIIPVPVLSGLAEYPSNDKIIPAVKEFCSDVIVFNATEKAEAVGNIRATNTVMLGALAATGVLPFPAETLKEIIEKKWPKFAEINLKAFDAGFAAVSEK